MTAPIKHSNATAVSVRVSGAPDVLGITIVDNGVGFEVGPAEGEGLGLISMHERLKLVNGRLVIDSKVGAGTIVRATVRIAEGDLVGGTPVLFDADLNSASP